MNAIDTFRQRFSFQLHGNIAGLALIIAILLPHIGALYLVNPLLLFLLWMRYSPSLSAHQLRDIKMVLVAIIVISLIWNLLYGIPIDSKSIIRGIYISEILLFFPYIGNLKFRNIYLYIITGVILLSQLAYLLDIGSVINLIDKFYPYTGDNISETADFLYEKSAQAQSLSDLQRIRFGGLFHNSNQCMKYISLCTVIFAIENYKKRFWRQLPFWTIISTSTLLAGSRTGFVIIFTTLILMLIILKKPDISLFRIILSLSLAYLLFSLLSSVLASEFRMFDLSSGTEVDEGSIWIKVDHFKYYINLVYEVRQILVGNFDIDSIRSVYHTPFSQFDSEWGNAIYIYGYLFLGIYFIYILKIFSSLRGINILAVLIFLWVISSTVLFSYRTSFACFLILSKCYSSSLQYSYDRNIL